MTAAKKPTNTRSVLKIPALPIAWVADQMRTSDRHGVRRGHGADHTATDVPSQSCGSSRRLPRRPARRRWIAARAASETRGPDCADTSAFRRARPSERHAAAMSASSALLFAAREGLHRLLVDGGGNLGGKFAEALRRQHAVVARMGDIDFEDLLWAGRAAPS